MTTAPPPNVSRAQEVLAALDFDAERTNERSALVLLALLGLGLDTPWSEATNPMLGTYAIMDWIRSNLNKDYAPNTRETIRRQTLHQFIDAGLVVENPDQPDRPINSPNWRYQVTSRAVELLRTGTEPGFDQRIKEYLAELPGLRTQYARAREMNRIPVTLPDGRAITLSPGGQNILLKQMVEDFCGLFTPGGTVLYVGDADEKYAVFEQDSLAQIGVNLQKRGKMPDLVVHLPDRNWLVLLEAASSHGPVDATRYGELGTLFGDSSAGLVFVSCFPSREAMRRYLSVIAWETEVWCADNPTHLIHFNGERFLGPYES
jgi:type II restriction enzyme